MKHSFFSVISFIIFSFMLTACGGGGGGGGSTGSASVPANHTTTDDKGTSFTIGRAQDPTAIFTPKPDLTENYTPRPEDR